MTTKVQKKIELYTFGKQLNSFHIISYLRDASMNPRIHKVHKTYILIYVDSLIKLFFETSIVVFTYIF